MDLQKRDFLDMYLTTVFWVRNFENTSAMRVMFLENVQNLIEISKMGEKIEKNVFLLEINASELAALNCLY